MINVFSVVKILVNVGAHANPVVTCRFFPVDLKNKTARVNGRKKTAT
jgi:hypothetical protein